MVTVSNFNVLNDAIKTTLNATIATSGGYTAATAGGQTAVTALANGIIEIENSNLADFTATGDGLAVEAALLTAIGTIPDGTYTVVMYGSGNAAIYQMVMVTANAAGLEAAGEIVVEHLATLTGVAVNSFSSLNFYS